MAITLSRSNRSESATQEAATRRRRSYSRPLSLFLACLGLGGCVFSSGGMKHEARETQTLTANLPAKKLVVRQEVGDVTLIADPAATEIRAEATMIGRGTTREHAEDAVTEIIVTLDPSKGDSHTVEALVDHPKGSSRKQYAVDWKITAPPGLAVDLSCEVGDVVVEGFQSGALLEVGVGDVRAKQIAGGLTVEAGVGDIHAVAAAPIDVSGDVGDADVRVLSGSPAAITVRTGVGDLTLTLPRSLVGNVSARTGTGEVSIELPTSNVRRDADNRFEGRVGGSASGSADECKVELATDVGDVTVHAAADAS